MQKLITLGSIVDRFGGDFTFEELEAADLQVYSAAGEEIEAATRLDDGRIHLTYMADPDWTEVVENEFEVYTSEMERAGFDELDKLMAGMKVGLDALGSVESFDRAEDQITFRITLRAGEYIVSLVRLLGEYDYTPTALNATMRNGRRQVHCTAEPE